MKIDTYRMKKKGEELIGCIHPPDQSGATVQPLAIYSRSIISYPYRDPSWTCTTVCYCWAVFPVDWNSSFPRICIPYYIPWRDDAPTPKKKRWQHFFGLYPPAERLLYPAAAAAVVYRPPLPTTDESILLLLLLLCLHRGGGERARTWETSERVASQTPRLSCCSSSTCNVLLDSLGIKHRAKKEEGLSEWHWWRHRREARNGLSVWKHANQDCLSLWRRNERTNREIEQERGGWWESLASILRPSLLIRVGKPVSSSTTQDRIRAWRRPKKEEEERKKTTTFPVWLAAASSSMSQELRCCAYTLTMFRCDGG